jgi:hypothetical protein
MRILLAALCLLATLPANAQELFFYPMQDQSPELQTNDRAECEVWARDQTGFDPTQPAPGASPAPAEQGQVVGGAARGAALGAVGGAIGGDAGKGAAVGAGVGAAAGLLHRRRDRIDSGQAQQQAHAEQQGDITEFNRAVSGCMQGRGYSVS